MARSTSAAASTSTSTAPNSDYDVFINHRGLDVKKTFASHLYRRLQSYGLRVFLDQPELQRGDYFAAQIEGAIRYASVHVAIFSSGYAESTWCLRELILMLQSNSPVIPVFYKVKPEELRWTRGKEGGYAKALEGLEKKTSTDPQTGEEKLRYDPSLIQNWRNALFEAAGISGFELEACNGDEGELVDNVVEEVLKKVKKRALAVAKYPTGLADKVTEFENTVLLPRQQSGKPQMLGIVGLGGVGKTTLAKEFFNRKSSGYSRSCFLSDVRDNAGKGSLNLLQKELLKSLTGWDKPIGNVHEGKTILKDHISSPNILVILDDVDTLDQVDELFPDQTLLHSDSLIIITSRSKDVLRRSGVEESSIYKLTGLSTEQSLELFCLYSFNQSHPLPGFESLVWKFIEACGGLPLSLKVFGALLNGEEDASYWEAQLDKLQRILPEEIKQRLQISYDALDREDRQIFLDIACFFIGEDRDRVIRICYGSGGNGSWGFRNLENKCLVEVNSANRIRMHDHLRDMGREIADASLPRRLWRSTEKIDDLLQQSSVINEVRGIKMTDYSSVMPQCQRSSELFWHCFMKLCNKQYPSHGSGICMRNLQLLHTGGVLVKRILTKVQFRNLVWLRWDSCPYSSLHSSISYLKTLRVLQVKGRKLKTLWKKESQAPLQLRELEIEAPLSSIPKSIGKLTQLEVIEICAYNSVGKVTVTQLPEEFCFLQSLKDLELEGFSEMKSLPERFGELTNLRQISLRKCSAMKSLPERFGELTNLQQIDLLECPAMKSLPERFGELTNLRKISFSGCSAMESLPERFGELTNLRDISLSGCSAMKSLPERFGELTNLRQISLTWCTAMKSLPERFGELTNLRQISFSECSAMESPPEQFGELTNRLQISFSECSAMESLPERFGELTNLRQISFSQCSAMESLPERFGELTNLGQISLDGCSAMKSLPERFGELTNLRQISLDGCSALKRLPDSLGNLANLHHINLTRCYALERLPDSFCKLNELQHLGLSACFNLIMSSKTLGNVSTLLYIDLSGCRKVEVLPPQVLHQVSLRELYLRDTNIKELPSAIGELHDLEVLQVGALLCALPPSLCSLKSLKKLGLYYCDELKCLPASLGDLRNLKELRIYQCEELERLPTSLGLLTQLTELTVTGCPLIRELLEVGTLPNTLFTLSLEGCHSLRKMDNIYGLAKLHTLNIRDCIGLEELPCLETLVSLGYLYASGCVKLKRIRGLGQLTKLCYVTVDGCSKLEELEGIQHCMRLWKLGAKECPKLQWDAAVVKQLSQRMGRDFQIDSYCVPYCLDKVFIH